MRNCLSAQHPENQLTAGEDSSLVRAAQADRTAFGAIYDRYFDRVYAYLYARTGSEEDAADLTQQVFLQALDAIACFVDRRVPLAAWLFRIAHNALSNHRRSARRGPDLIPGAPIEPVDPAPDVASTVQLRDDLQRLARTVAALDVRSQELLALRFTVELTIAEIAVVIGKSEAATQKQLYRLIHRLQEQCHEYF